MACSRTHCSASVEWVIYVFIEFALFFFAIYFSVVDNILFNVLPLFAGVTVLRLSLFCYAFICIHSSFAISLKSWLLYYYCLTDVLLL